MDLKNVLKGVELFHSLTDTELNQVVGIFQELKLERGNLIAEQGKPGDALFLITEGFAEVRRGEGGQDAQVLVNLGKGQIIGEMSLVDKGPRSATVRALSSPTVVHRVTRQDFEALCEKNTRIGYVVMRNIAADLSFKLRQRNLSA